MPVYICVGCLDLIAAPRPAGYLVDAFGRVGAVCPRCAEARRGELLGGRS